MQYFAELNLFPGWVLEPSDKFVRGLPENYAAYEDFGNENWEALVNLMNLSSVIPSVYGQETFNAASNVAYGDRVNKSGVGSYNFRGNVVERLLTHLLCESEEEGLVLVSPGSKLKLAAIAPLLHQRCSAVTIAAMYRIHLFRGVPSR